MTFWHIQGLRASKSAAFQGSRTLTFRGQLQLCPFPVIGRNTRIKLIQIISIVWYRLLQAILAPFCTKVSVKNFKIHLSDFPIPHGVARPASATATSLSPDLHAPILISSWTEHGSTAKLLHMLHVCERHFDARLP